MIPGRFSQTQKTFIPCRNGKVVVTPPLRYGGQYLINAPGRRTERADLSDLARMVRELVELSGGLLESARDIVNNLLEAGPAKEPNVDKIYAFANQWFRKNVRQIRGWRYELGLNLYWSSEGKVVAGTVAQGGEAEVVMPDEPHLGLLVGSIHTHTGSSAELSEFDFEEGQKAAKQNGFHAMFVIGPDDEDPEGEAIKMVDELFEPEE